MVDKNDTPLVKGGQGRTGANLSDDAVGLTVIAIVALMVLGVVAVLS